MVNVRQEFRDWRDLPIGPLSGGLNTDADSELIETNELVRATNAVLTYGQLERDTGYALVGAAVRGDPRRVIEYVYPSTGGTVRFLITDLTCYAWNFSAQQWQYVSNGTETTISSNEAGGQTALSVTSITGFSNGDFVGIELDTGVMHFSTVNGAPGGGVITILDALPSQASTGKAVIKAPVLTASASFAPTAVVIPWSGNVVFTNGIDNVKHYDPLPGLNGSVVDLTGTGFPANTKARTLALFDSSLLLGSTAEGGVIFRSRIRYCAKGDLTLWNTLEAGTIDLLENFDEIMQALELGPYLILYRKGGITRLSIGGAGRFIPDPVVPGEGVSGVWAAAQMIDKHFVIGRNKFFWYRGGFSVEPIEYNIKASIWGPVGDVKAGFIPLDRMFPIFLTATNEIIISYGAGTSGRPYPRLHVGSQKWTKRAFNAGSHEICGGSVVTGSLVANRVFICDAVGNFVYEYDRAATTDGGQTLTFTVETKDFSHPEFLLTTDWLDITLSGSGNVTVDYSVDKGASWASFGAGTIAVTATPTRTRLYQQKTSRFIRFRFTTTNPVVLHWLNLRYKYTAEW